MQTSGPQDPGSFTWLSFFLHLFCCNPVWGNIFQCYSLSTDALQNYFSRFWFPVLFLVSYYHSFTDFFSSSEIYKIDTNAVVKQSAIRHKSSPKIM